MSEYTLNFNVEATNDQISRFIYELNPPEEEEIYGKPVEFIRKKNKTTVIVQTDFECVAKRMDGRIYEI